MKDRLVLTAKVFAVCAAASYTFYRSLPVLLISFPVASVIYPGVIRNRLREEMLWRLLLQFREAIWIMSGFLSAGLSVENAIIAAIPELNRVYGEDAMICREFSSFARGIRLNKSVEAMLLDFASRSGVQDIRNFAEVFSIAKRNGGNMRAIIERTGNVIRDKTTVSEEIKNMTASRRYEQSIMNVLPFVLIIYINLTTSGFLDIMYTTLIGRAVMTLCLIMTGISYVISEKLLDIKV